MEWIPIEDAKPLKDGYMRLYTFKPVTDTRFQLSRVFDFQRVYGNRVCDMYIDIPMPDAEAIRARE